MEVWNSNRNSVHGASFPPAGDGSANHFGGRSDTAHGPPELSDELMRRAREMIQGAGVPAWAIAMIHRFSSPKDYRIVACVSEHARMNRGTADLSILEIAIHCDLPGVFAAARTEQLITDGTLICNQRNGDRYRLQVPEQPPPHWSTGPPGSAA
jgi:hypothetical protein